MGIYSKYIFPRIVEFALGGEKVGALRGKLLKGVQGKVLEIGFGTGLNLEYYPKRIRELHIVDPNPGMHALALRRMAKSKIKLKAHVLAGEALPYEDSTFDSVVCTFTLCSIPKVGQALCEVRRVLKPEGKFFFLEHGLSPDPKIQKWQHRITPVNKVIGDGCHLNRDMALLLEAADLRLAELRNFYFDQFPKFIGYLYEGVARKT